MKKQREPRIRNGGIGQGWAPEEFPEETKVIAENLLKGLLDDVFKIMQEKNKLRVKDERDRSSTTGNLKSR